MRNTTTGLLLMLLFVGCSPATDAPQVEDPPLPPADTTQSTPETSRVPGADRPQTMDGTINLEGMEEPMTYTLYRTSADFGIPFSTYLPEDMVTRESSSGEGEAVRFIANFGGELNAEAFMNVYFFPAGVTEPEALARAQEVAGTSEPDAQGSASYPWALEVYDLAASDRSGSVAVGEHAGRYFYIFTSYPPEFGDGMGPRLARIRDEWRWSDTDSALAG